MQTEQVIYYDLSEKVEHLRESMVAAGMTHGLNSKEVLACSEELDRLIFRIQTSICTKKENRN